MARCLRVYMGMKNKSSKHPATLVISPVFERRHPSGACGLAGFTVQIPSEPFMNHIRFYDSSNRDEKLAELNHLREQILEMLDNDITAKHNI